MTTKQRANKDQEAHVSSETDPRVLDGGYGWVVMLCAFVLQGASCGISFSVGVFFVEWLSAFEQSHDVTAWVGSLNTGLMFAGGPIASVLISSLGHRTVALMGCLLTTCSLLLASNATTVWFLFLSYGLLGGLGVCFMFIPGAVVCGTYFYKYRALSMGIATSGVGMFCLAMPPLLQMAVDYYGWRGAMICMSALSIQACVFAYLLFPVSFWKVPTSFKAIGSNGEDVGLINSKPCVDDCSDSGIHSSYDHCNSSDSGTGIHTFHHKPAIPAFSRIRKDIIHNSDSRIDIACYKPSTLKNSHSRTSVFKSNSNISHRLHATVHKLQNDDSMCNSFTALHTIINEKPILGSNNNNNSSISPKLNRQEYCDNTVDNAALNNTNLKLLNRSESEAQMLTSDTDSTTSWVNRKTGDSSCKENTTTDVHEDVTLLDKVLNYLVSLYDVDLLCDIRFYIFFVNNALWNCGSLIILVMVTDYAITSGVSKNKGAILLSVIGLCGLIGRVSSGVLANFTNRKAFVIFNTATFISAFAIGLIPLWTSFMWFVFMCGLYGVCFGAQVGVLAVTTIEIVGYEKLATAFGYIMLSHGIGALSGPPLAGLLYEVTHGYNVPFYFGGGISFLAALIACLIPIIDRCKINKTYQYEHEVTKAEEDA